jgi:hypothetical protein
LKAIHKHHGARNITCFLLGIGRKIGYKLTGHTYQESGQKKSTKAMTVDEEKKSVRNILGNRRMRNSLSSLSDFSMETA